MWSVESFMIYEKSVLHINVDCAILITRGLIKNRNLKSIDLSWNDLCGIELAEALTAVLIRNKTLEIINLEFNNLSEIELNTIAPALRRTNVKQIYLDGNPIIDECILTLLQTIQTKNTLEILSFGLYKEISLQCANIIKKINSKFPALQLVHGRIIMEEPLPDVNFGEILLKRCNYLALKPKLRKLKRNMNAFFESVRSGEQYCDQNQFEGMLKKFGAKLDEDLLKQMTNHWSIKISNKIMVDLHSMAFDYEIFEKEIDNNLIQMLA